MNRRRRFVLIVLAALLLLTPPAIAVAASHWHSILQPVHYDRKAWLGTPFPFTVDFRYTTQFSGCLHTDVVQYREWGTGASDVHYLRHAHC